MGAFPAQITRSYYRGAAGALLVYSVAHRPSFDNVKNWLEDVRSHAEESVSIVLVGNQLDLCKDDDEEGEETDANASRGDTAEEDLNPDQDSEDTTDGENTLANNKKSPSNQRKSQSDGALKKSTKKRRQVSTEEAKEFAEKEGIMFVETSAKTGQNVEEAFTITAKDIHSKFLSKNPNTTSSNPNERSGGANNGVNRRSGARANNGSLSLNRQDNEGGRNSCCVLM